MEFDENIQNSDTIHINKPLKDVRRYQRLVGRLLYLTIISFVVQVLSQFMHAPKESHMKEALRVVKFIRTTPGFRVVYAFTKLKIVNYLL